MKKVLLLIAFVAMCFVAKAQDYSRSFYVDTLSYEKLTADYIALNKQLMDFKKFEVASICAAGIATGSFLTASLMAVKNPESSKTMFVIGGVSAAAATVFSIVGITKIKRDRLEIMPNGVVLKLKPKFR